MTESAEIIIFLCSNAAKTGKKPSYRVACQLNTMGIAAIGSLQHLSQQHDASSIAQKKMIFINDCRSGCVNVLTQGFAKEQYIFVDLSRIPASNDFDAEKYIDAEILPAMNEKWNYSLPAQRCA